MSQTASPPATYRQQVDDATEALQSLGPAPSVAMLAEASVFSVLDDGEPEGETRLALPPGENGEPGSLVRLGTLAGTRAAWMQMPRLADGRSAKEAAAPVRALAAWGVESFVLLGAATALDAPPAVMLLRDHLNLQGANPLTGANEADWGPRFPDMTAPYDSSWRAAVREAVVGRVPGTESLAEGVYAALPAPGLATDERAALRRMGADAAGAGFAPQVLAARHMDRRVLAAVVLTEAGEDADSGTEGHEGLEALVRAALAGVGDGAGA